MQNYCRRSFTANRNMWLQLIQILGSCVLLEIYQTKYQTEIPEWSHKLDVYSKIFFDNFAFSHSLDTFLSTQYHIRGVSLAKFLETLSPLQNNEFHCKTNGIKSKKFCNSAQPSLDAQVICSYFLVQLPSLKGPFQVR